MKKLAQFIKKSRNAARISAILFCSGLLSAHSLIAGESPKAQEDYSNWVDFTLRGLSIDGDKAQFKQANHTSGNISGGIEDMHYENALTKKAMLNIDVRALFDTGDYKVKLELTQSDVGYVRAGYTLFRTWYDGNGGFLPSISGNYPNGQFFGPGNNQLSLDRGDAWIEFGLRVPDLPEITIRYDHEYRHGEKDSTSWGTAYLNPPLVITSNLPTLNQRKAMPSFWDINETRDILTLDVTKTFFGNSDAGVGMRYEYNKNDDSLNQINQGNRGFSNQTYLTQVEQLSLDLYSGHISWLTRFSDKFWLTTAYSYTTMNSDTGDSRLSGTTGFFPIYNPLQPVAAFINLGGGSESQKQVFNLNLMWVPIKDLTITPAFRLGIEDTDSNAPYTVTTASVLTTGTHYLALSNNHFNESEESLDIRYTGIDNILLYLRGDWDQRYGNYDQSQNIIASGSQTIRQNADTTYLSQKYAGGFNWYPLMRLNFALQYYFKTEQNDFNWFVPGNVNGGVPKAGTNLGIINNQSVDTNDVNFRVTWRPCSCVSLVSRYDMQYVTMDNAGIGGGTASGALVPSVYLDNVQSAKITNNMFTESLTVCPLPNLYIQGNASLVRSETDTPAGNINLTANGPSYTTPTVLNFKNNYYQLSCDVGYAIDDKTNANVCYSYYRANDYQNNITVGMPYGAGAIENTVSANITRKLSKQISVSLKYAYYTYSDQTSGYNNNYRANMIYSKMQIRF